MSLKVVSYNLCGATAETIEKIVELVKDVDIVAFQEVPTKGINSRLFDVTVAAMKKRDFTFRRFDSAFSARSYMELLFVKHALLIVDTVYLPFKRSTANHGISIYVLSMKVSSDVKTIIQVCTAQIESSATVSVVVQRQQLDQLRDTIKLDSSPSIILADTNIRGWQSTIGDMGGYTDVWREAGKQSTEITYDSKRNPIAQLDSEDACDRRDRIYVRGMESVDCRLIGDTTKPSLSSHYGVCATLKLT